MYDSSNQVQTASLGMAWRRYCVSCAGGVLDPQEDLFSKAAEVRSVLTGVASFGRCDRRRDCEVAAE